MELHVTAANGPMVARRHANGTRPLGPETAPSGLVPPDTPVGDRYATRPTSNGRRPAERCTLGRIARRPAMGHGLGMTTMTTIPTETIEPLAPATLHAHHDADAAEAVAQRAADVVSSIAAFRSATAGRGYAAATPSTLIHLEAATGDLAAAVDELRVETLWHLRDIEPAASNDDHVDATAQDFSTLAGRLYAAQQATVALRRQVER
jgi:hypothetical protein